MNRTAKRTLIGAVAAGVVTMSFTLSGWSMPGEGSPHFINPERMFARLADKLELEDEQRAEIREIFSQSHEALSENRTRLHELREELSEMDASFDPQQARSVADEIGDITADLAYGHATSKAAIYELLSDEQREQFGEMMDRHPRARHAMRHRFQGE